MRAIILFEAEKLIKKRYTKISTGSYFKRPHIKQKKKLGFSCNLPSIIKFEAKSLISLPKIRITEIILKQFKLGLKTCHEKPARGFPVRHRSHRSHGNGLYMPTLSRV